MLILLWKRHLSNLIRRLQKKIRDLGYDVITNKTEFDITGMACAACASRIEKVLNKQEGTTKASVNLALEKATVEYDPNSIDTEDIIKKVDNIGYGATVHNE
jgi:P-type Cu+ transporter